MKAIFLLAIAVPLAHAAFAADPTVKSACGGITAEERRALPTMVPDANVELLFVSGKRGAYVAGVQWRVFDRSNEPIAYGLSEGPQCFLRLPAAAARVEARLGDEVRTSKLTLPRGGKAARLVFTFTPKQEEDIEASPEEKAQGRS